MVSYGQNLAKRARHSPKRGVVRCGVVRCCRTVVLYGQNLAKRARHSKILVKISRPSKEIRKSEFWALGEAFYRMY